MSTRPIERAPPGKGPANTDTFAHQYSQRRRKFRRQGLPSGILPGNWPAAIPPVPFAASDFPDGFFPSSRGHRCFEKILPELPGPYYAAGGCQSDAGEGAFDKPPANAVPARTVCLTALHPAGPLLCASHLHCMLFVNPPAKFFEWPHSPHRQARRMRPWVPVFCLYCGYPPAA